MYSTFLLNCRYCSRSKYHRIHSKRCTPNIYKLLTTCKVVVRYPGEFNRCGTALQISSVYASFTLLLYYEFSDIKQQKFYLSGCRNLKRTLLGWSWDASGAAFLLVSLWKEYCLFNFSFQISYSLWLVESHCSALWLYHLPVFLWLFCLHLSFVRILVITVDSCGKSKVIFHIKILDSTTSAKFFDSCK